MFAGFSVIPPRILRRDGRPAALPVARSVAFRPWAGVPDCGRATIVILSCGVNRLTRQEQLVICIILGLLLTGWGVKMYRTAHPPDQAVQRTR